MLASEGAPLRFSRMEITCSRCNTLYEIDHLLLSERGTNVRCAHCGETFRVVAPRRPTAASRWTRSDSEGRERVSAPQPEDSTAGETAPLHAGRATRLPEVPPSNTAAESPVVRALEPSPRPGTSGGARVPGPALLDEPLDEWFEEPRFSSTPSTHTRALRWLVTLVVLGSAGLLSAAFGHGYAHRAAALWRDATTLGGEARTSEILDEGERALTEGDFERAKESFDKASVLDENSPRALVDLARLFTTRADLDWLRIRLLVQADPPVLDAARRQLVESSARAQKACARAGDVADEHPELERARLDLLRITGDVAGARGQVPRLSSVASQPETLYSLAALDLDELAPTWPSLLERLRVAASADGNPVRARATYAYALARAGHTARARDEVDRLIAATPASPLLTDLHAYVTRASSPAAEGTPSSSAYAKRARQRPEPPAPGASSLASEGRRREGEGEPNETRHGLGADPQVPSSVDTSAVPGSQP